MNFIKSAKRMLVGAVSVGSTMLIAACYGVYESSQQLAFGRITTENDTTGVSALTVCISNNDDSARLCDYTAEDGSYSIYQYNYDENDPSLFSEITNNGGKICVTDEDGAANGGDFETQCTNINAGEALPVHIDFVVVPKPVK